MQKRLEFSVVIMTKTSISIKGGHPRVPKPVGQEQPRPLKSQVQKVQRLNGCLHFSRCKFVDNGTTCLFFFQAKLLACGVAIWASRVVAVHLLVFFSLTPQRHAPLCELWLLDQQLAGIPIRNIHSRINLCNNEACFKVVGSSKRCLRGLFWW